jgi:glycosyltransferase involved in cell wall biosynthesis
MESPGIEFIGEVAQEEKNELNGHAYGVLFPINGPEPFGLVMIEAMACGTPVIAFRRKNHKTSPSKHRSVDLQRASR